MTEVEGEKELLLHRMQGITVVISSSTDSPLDSKLHTTV